MNARRNLPLALKIVAVIGALCMTCIVGSCGLMGFIATFAPTPPRPTGPQTGQPPSVAMLPMGGSTAPVQPPTPAALDAGSPTSLDASVAAVPVDAPPSTAEVLAQARAAMAQGYEPTTRTGGNLDVAEGLLRSIPPRTREGRSAERMLREVAARRRRAEQAVLDEQLHHLARRIFVQELRQTWDRNGVEYRQATTGDPIGRTDDDTILMIQTHFCSSPTLTATWVARQRLRSLGFQTLICREWEIFGDRHEYNL